MAIETQPGDIFFTRGRGFVSRAIRVLSRSIGESKTQVNHVGIVVANGIGVEAVSKGVVCRAFLDYYASHGDMVFVFRPTNLTQAELDTVVNTAESYLGKKYGYAKIAAHFLDYLLLGANVFRRIARADNYPICSFLVADAFKAISKDFAVPMYTATPDDIWDFVTRARHADKYTRVL